MKNYFRHNWDLAVVFLSVTAGCAVPQPGASGPERDQAEVFGARLYALSKTPDPGLENVLPELVSQSHDYAFKYSGDAPADAGFSYTLTPKGAVYPFSEVEVECVIRRKYASRYGDDLCSVFFSELDKKIKKTLKSR